MKENRIIKAAKAIAYPATVVIMAGVCVCGTAVWVQHYLDWFNDN